MIHENHFQSPPLNPYVCRALHQRTGGGLAGELYIVAGSPGCVRPPCWIRPPRRLAKINVDAAIFQNLGHTAVAAIVRDEGGKFLGASALIIEGSSYTEVVKVIACHERLALQVISACRQLGWPATIVPSGT